MKTTEFCNHYQAMSDHKECKAGVAYDTFKGLKFDERPCFERNGVAPTGCPLAVFPTPEERAEYEREMNERFAAIGKARQAIVTSLGGPWKRGKAGSQGTITCPVCNGDNALRFTRSGYNGHIHAACKTEGCVRWME